MPKHAPLPFHLYVNVDNAFLGPEMAEGVTRGLWHGIYCREGQILSCHVMLASGAHWSGLPLHALSTSDTFLHSPSMAMPWGGMGSQIEAIHFPYLEGLEVEIRETMEAKGRHTGIVVDWADGYSRYPQEHKPLSLVVLEKGPFVLLPNNFMLFRDDHFVDPDRREDVSRYRRGETVFWEGEK